MESEREHLLEDRDRRLHMRDTSVFGPGAVPWNVHTQLRGNRKVLMPHDGPIRIRCLVEEECVDGETGIAKDAGRELAQDW